MKLYNHFLGIVILASSFLVSCQNELAFETEQYMKQVYLVGACEDILEKDIPYGGEQEFFVSVAISGSTESDKDVVVKLCNADKSNIDTYNKKFVIEGEEPYQELPTDWYSFVSEQVVIPAGDTYVRIPIKLKTDKIDCDERYMLPLKIENVSDYKITEKDTVLLVAPTMVNDYSGTFVVEGTYQEVSQDGELVGTVSVLSANRVLTAVSENKVRFFHKAVLERPENISESTLTITVNPDSSVLIKGWDKLQILAGGGTYQADKNVFNIWYDYQDGSRIYRMKLQMKGLI